MKRSIRTLLLLLFIGFAMAACQKDSEESGNTEQVDELIQSDQEKADSLKRALGIESDDQ